jgi:hypothetical protein
MGEEMEPFRRGHRRKFSKEIKKSILNSVETDGIGSVSKKYNISNGLIYRWKNESAFLEEATSADKQENQIQHKFIQLNLPLEQGTRESIVGIQAVEIFYPNGMNMKLQVKAESPVDLERIFKIMMSVK